MAKKKINSLDDLGGFVFSTNKDFDFDTPAENEETPEPSKQLLEVYLDKKKQGR